MTIWGRVLTQATEIMFILSAGALTLLSPCGYPLFLAYLSYYIGSKIPVKRVILGGSIAAAGFLTVFSAIGIVPAFAGQVALHYLPLLEVVAFGSRWGRKRYDSIVIVDSCKRSRTITLTIIVIRTDSNRNTAVWVGRGYRQSTWQWW